MYAVDDFQYYHYGSIVSYSAAVLFCNNLQYILVIYKSGLPKSFRLFMFVNTKYPKKPVSDDLFLGDF